MKFDYCIGNPPYQEESAGDSTGKNPVYHLFMEEASHISDIVELITPARFLFDAGKTPKDFNQRMLKSEHFKVLSYEQDPNKIFPGVPITGGVAITCYNKTGKYIPVDKFLPYAELRSIVKKVINYKNFCPLTEIIQIHCKFDLKRLYESHPEYKVMMER